MKPNTAKLFQALVALAGAAALAFLVWEPTVEGRNAHATLYQIYCTDFFLAYAYIGSIPFFMALRQAFKAFGYAGRDMGLSPEMLKSLRTIKYCAIAVVCFVAGGELILMRGESDDRAGGVFMGALITLASVAIGAAAARFERAARGGPPAK